MILASLWIIVMLSVAIPAYGYGIALTKIEADTGWSRAGLSAVASLIPLVGLLSPLAGLVVQRIGGRWAIFGGGVMASAAGTLAFSAPSIAVFLVGAGLMAGLAIMFMQFLPPYSIVFNWFSQRRALAAALLSTGTSMGGLLGGPFTRFLLDWTDDWRFVWLAYAACGGLTALIAWLIVRDRPAASSEAGRWPDIGLQEAGAVEPGDPPSGAQVPLVDLSGTRDWPVWPALRAASFWGICLAGGAGLASVLVVLVHGPAQLERAGFSPQEAARIVPITAGLSLLSRAGAGLIGDRVPRRVLTALSLFLLAAGLLILWLNTASRWALYAGGAIIGAGWGPWIPLLALLVRDYFGETNFSSLLGIYRGVQLGLGSAGPLAAGIIYSALGSYDLAYVALVSVSIAGGSLVLLKGHPGVWRASRYPGLRGRRMPGAT